jgi:tetratricopeptide (TPR) repeat protein
MKEKAWFHGLAAAAALATVVCAAGCAKTVNFSVIRAAKVNVPGLAAAAGTEPKVSIDKWTAADPAWAGAAEEIAQYVREAITNAPGGVVKFAEAGGVVTLQGNLVDNSFKESETKEEHTCTDQKNVKFTCIDYKRTGTAHLRISMNVVDSGGRTVASETVPLERSEQSNHFNVSKAEVDAGTTTGGAPPIDWEGTLAGLRAEAGAKLASLVVPHPVTVTKRWFKCGDANDQCEAGMAQLKASNFPEAINLFQQAIDKLKAAPKQDTEDLAAAYWAITLAHEFGGDYPSAKETLREAIRLAPGEETYAAEAASIRTEEENAKKLAGQGVTAAQGE